MRITREIVTPRVRCPFCGGDRKRVTKTMPRDGFGDVSRYCTCLACGGRFTWRETDDAAESSTSWNPAARAILS